jgi:putative thiamine transport system ATP-binding protein
MSLELKEVSVGPKGGKPLFAPISLQVAAGTVGTLMGPSGIGKSTLLDAIGGHLAHGFVVSGAVRLDGRDVLAQPAEARRIGVLFQDALLFPHLSVGITLPLALRDRCAVRRGCRPSKKR